MIAAPVGGLAMRTFVKQAWELRSEHPGCPLIVHYYAGTLIALYEVPAGRRARQVLCDEERIAFELGVFEEHTPGTLKAAVKSQLARHGLFCAPEGKDKSGL